MKFLPLDKCLLISVNFQTRPDTCSPQVVTGEWAVAVMQACRGSVWVCWGCYATGQGPGRSEIIISANFALPADKPTDLQMNPASRVAQPATKNINHMIADYILHLCYKEYFHNSMYSNVLGRAKILWVCSAF